MVNSFVQNLRIKKSFVQNNNIFLVPFPGDERYDVFKLACLLTAWVASVLLV